MRKYFTAALYQGPRPDLTGKVAVVTGGNSGIGREIVAELAQRNCKVIIGARDVQKSSSLLSRLNEKTEGLYQQFPLDLSDLESIKNFATKVKVDKIDFLINNAGVMALPQRA